MRDIRLNKQKSEHNCHDVSSSFKKLSALRGKEISAREFKIDITFKLVRYGLNIALTVFLLCLYSMFYVRPGETEFYICIFALVCDMIVFLIISIFSIRARKAYKKLSQTRNKEREIAKENSNGEPLEL